jgi:hypothetical protein
MANVARTQFRIGVEFKPGFVTRLVWADTFALAQAHLIVFARLLRAGGWRGTLVIVRESDAVVLERVVIPDHPAG